MTGAASTRCVAGRHAVRCTVLSWKPSAEARRQKTAVARGCIACVMRRTKAPRSRDIRVASIANWIDFFRWN
eukprot:5874381-Prymnesium_polylepis.1